VTDLSPAVDPTSTCSRCGAQTDGRRSTCDACGAPLRAARTEDQRGDLELEEVWRSAAAGGFDTEFALHDQICTCPACGTEFVPTVPALDGKVDVRDTPTDRTGLQVATLRCPRCGTPGRLIMEAGALATVGGGRPDRAGADDVPTEGTWPGPEAEQEDGRADEVSWRHPPPPGATERRPLGEDRKFFEEAASLAGGNLADQRDLIDEDGDDIREYTGEPVETEEGWVLPQQQNVGPGNMAGGGEWPDPHRPSAQPGTGGEDPR
jgi:hypothetical protein